MMESRSSGPYFEKLLWEAFVIDSWTILREVILLFLSLMPALPLASPFALQTFSCDQSWISQLPSTIEASLAFSSDGAHIAIGEFIDWASLPPGSPNVTNHLIYITPQPVQQITFNSLGESPYAPWRISMAEDGYNIAAALKGGGVQLFSRSYHEFDWKFPGTVSENLGLSGDGKNLAALVMNATSNVLFVLSTAYPYGTIWTYRFAGSIGNTSSYQDVGISYDGSRIAALMGRSLFVFSKNSNQTLWSKVVESPQTDTSDIIGASETQVFMSHDGNRLVTIEDANINIYSTATGAVEKSFSLDGAWWPGIVTPDETVAISKDGSTLGVTTGGKLKVWDLNSGTELFSKTVLDQFTLGSYTVTEEPLTVSLSQNGTSIVVGGQQRGVFVYDRAGNELCKTYAGYVNVGATPNVKVSDDGNHVAAYAQDTAVLITVSPHDSTLLLIVGIGGAAAAVIIAFLLFRRRRKSRVATLESVENGKPSKIG